MISDRIRDFTVKSFVPAMYASEHFDNTQLDKWFS